MCGAVQFSISAEPRFVAECVCESCRRAHGASVVAWVGVNTENFHIQNGGSEVNWYASSTASQRGFCQQCGTRMFFRSSKWAGETHMALALFDEPHNLKSTGFSFASEKPNWTQVELT